MITQLYSISDPEEALKVIELGCDHIGLSPKSHVKLKNELTFEEIEAIKQAVGDKATIVALSIEDEEQDVLNMVQAVKPDIVHLCGGNIFATPELVRKIKELVPGIRVMQAVGVTGPESVEQSKYYAGFVDLLILDTVASDIYGIGSAGATHDWSISRKIVEEVGIPVILAGGLTAENVADAIRAVRPWGVDSLTFTNKFLPDGRRVKDLEKVAAFCKAAKEAVL